MAGKEIRPTSGLELLVVFFLIALGIELRRRDTT
jgi:hypothetical protein